MSKPRKFFKIAALGILLTGLALAIWAFAIEPNLLFVNNYPIKVKGWDPALNHFKIVAISDIHAGSNFIDEAKIREIVRLANEQDADVIVLLGDYVSQWRKSSVTLKMPVRTMAENLKGLKARLGVYAVMGNHDGWYGIERTRAALEEVGIPVLENEAVTVEKNGAKLRIVGLPDSLSTNLPKNNIPNAKAALERMENKEGKVIALTHHPDDIYTVTDGGPFSPDFVLMLAAHTHGGQISLPFVGAPFNGTGLGRGYTRGFFYLRGVNLFITSGIGTSILPVRFGVAPEIAVLDISAE